MKRTIVVLFAVLCTGSSLAQLPGGPGGPGGPPQAPRKPPMGKDVRIKYILRQLDLTPDQTRQAEGLIESFSKTEQPSQEEFLAKVNALSEEFKKAQAANDKKEMDRLSEALRGLGNNSVEEPQLIASLRAILNDTQKAEMDATLERLKTNSAGLFRPIDVYRAATKLGLTAEQNAKLEEGLTGFREQVVAAQPARDTAAIDAQRNQHNEMLIARIRPILTADQATKFDKRMAALRPDAAPAAPQPTPTPTLTPTPTTGPAKP